ncbi:MAG: helix-turn-helix domain-containing protein [Rhodobacteraceae bacterium]|nr:helix-turn-helix domain-containing protein [Paracoccaceae bacterium]
MPKPGTPVPSSVKRESHPRNMLLSLATLYDIEGEVREALAGQVEPHLTGTLGDILKQSRQVSGLRVIDVHERCGVARSQLGELEHDRFKNPGVSLLQKVAHGYGLPFYVVLMGAMRTTDQFMTPARQRTRCARKED